MNLTVEREDGRASLPQQQAEKVAGTVGRLKGNCTCRDNFEAVRELAARSLQLTHDALCLYKAGENVAGHANLALACQAERRIGDYLEWEKLQTIRPELKLQFRELSIAIEHAVLGRFDAARSTLQVFCQLVDECKLYGPVRK